MSFQRAVAFLPARNPCPDARLAPDAMRVVFAPHVATTPEDAAAILEHVLGVAVVEVARGGLVLARDRAETWAVVLPRVRRILGADHRPTDDPLPVPIRHVEPDALPKAVETATAGNYLGPALPEFLGVACES